MITGESESFSYFLLGVITFAILYTWAVFFVEWYSWHCFKRDEGEISQAEKDYVPGKRISKDNRVLFVGPRAKLIETMDLYLSHGPTFIGRLFQLTIYRTIPLMWKYLTTSEFVNTTVTDEVIFDAIKGSSLSSMTKIDESGEKLICQFPSDFVCTTLRDGFCPAGLEIVMNIKDKTMERGHIKDKRLSNEQVMVAVTMATTGWVHPQIHVSSEKCAREISKNPSTLEEIKESGRHTVALHDGLLFGILSPAPVDGCQSILTTSLNEEEFFEYAQKKKVVHDLDHRKKQFRYFRFMYEARMATFELVKKHQIKINPELVFNNVVLHSVDHYSFGQVQSGIGI